METLGRASKCLNSLVPLDGDIAAQLLQAQETRGPGPGLPYPGPGGWGEATGRFWLSIGDAPLEYPPQSVSTPGEPCVLPSAGEDLRVRRRRGTGGTESSKINGLAENKLSEDFFGSSSGYSSEDDYAGRAGRRELLRKTHQQVLDCWGGGGKPGEGAPGQLESSVWPALGRPAGHSSCAPWHPEPRPGVALITLGCD